MPVTIELQPLETQTALNLKRWSEILDDPELARLPHRIETDRHGHIVITPPPAPFHGQKQSFISSVLQRLLPQGTVITECPVSTSDGVKAIDVAWLDAPRRQEMPFALSAHRKFASKCYLPLTQPLRSAKKRPSISRPVRAKCRSVIKTELLRSFITGLRTPAADQKCAPIFLPKSTSDYSRNGF